MEWKSKADYEENLKATLFRSTGQWSAWPWNEEDEQEVVCCLVAQLCLTLCNPMDCSLPGSSVHGISQARILEWVAISSSRGDSWLRDPTHISCIGRRILYHWATREAQVGSLPKQLNSMWLISVAYIRKHPKEQNQHCSKGINWLKLNSSISLVYSITKISSRL